MKRDFTESTKQELLTLVSQVESEKWCDATDWIGDRWYAFEAWLGDLDIKDYVNNVSDYHKKVIDKNNTTTDNIIKIFEDVNIVSNNYRSRFVALLVNLQTFKKQIENLALVVEPSNGRFNSDYISGNLKYSIDLYLQNSDILKKISGGGLTQQDIKDMDPSQMQVFLDTYVSVILEMLPDVTVGKEMEVAIGPGVSIYYKVSATVDGGGQNEAQFNGVVEDQQEKLKSFKFTHDFGSVLASVESNGRNAEIAVETEAGHAPEIKMSSSGISVTYRDKLGCNTYSSTYEMNFIQGEFIMEEAITTKLEDGSITSAAGIKFSDDNNWELVPVPVPVTVPVESPYTSQVPEVDVEWEEVLGTVAVVGGVLYVAKKLAGVALIPFTGGGSLILTVT